MAAILGWEGVLNYKVDGQGGAGAWVELTNVKNVTLNLEAGEADVTTRANNGWRATVPTLKDGTVEFEMVWDEADTGFTEIKDAFLGNEMIGLQVLTGATGQGLQGDFAVTNFSRNEDLEEAMTVSVTMKLTYSTTAPTWINE